MLCIHSRFLVMQTYDIKFFLSLNSNNNRKWKTTAAAAAMLQLLEMHTNRRTKIVSHKHKTSSDNFFIIAFENSIRIEIKIAHNMKKMKRKFFTCSKWSWLVCRFVVVVGIGCCCFLPCVVYSVSLDPYAFAWKRCLKNI